MDINLTARGKVRDIEAINDHSPEDINVNLDVLFQDVAETITQLKAYEIDLANADDITGNLPLANITGGTSGQVLTGNGTTSAPSYQVVTAGIPVPVGSATAGRRVCWFQKANGTNDSTLTSVGHAALTATGGSGIFDDDGHWGRPTSAVGATARYTGDLFTRTELLPTLAVRLRTSSSAANIRIRVGLTESSSVDADSPTTGTQEGLYFRYSTAVPDAGWVAQSVAGAVTTSASIVSFAASTIYYMTIVVNSTTSVEFSVNGTTTTITTNIPTATNLRPEILVRSLDAGAVQSFDVESFYISSR